MEEIKNQIVALAKKAIKLALKWLFRLLKPVIAVALVIILLAASVYYIVVHVDGSEREEDWSSVPFAASSHASGTSINTDGTITNSNNIQETWDRMVENGSRIEQYLDSPEELARLINAELTTQMPDTRPNPDAPMDWENVDLMDNTVQGIVKFKRADSNGNISTLTYAEPYRMDGWIEEYRTTGSETAKNEALSHFTIKQSVNTSTSAGTNAGTNIVTSGNVADVSQAIVNEAIKQDTYGLTGSLCQTWVGKVYANSVTNGYIPSGCCAYWAGCQWGISSDFSQIVNGAAVWTGEGTYRATQCSTHTTGGCGHAGIYYKDESGNDWVFSLVNGRIKKDTLEHFLEYYGQGNTPVWGWHGGISVNMEDNNTTNSSTTVDQNTNQNTNQNTSQNTNTTTSQGYYVEVATWNQTDTTLETNDPNVETNETHSYQMTTTPIRYQQMISKYTMPFDLLWAFLVIGEDKDFVMELADLAYNSQIEITVHDNYTKDTQVDVWTYTQEVQYKGTGTATATGTSVNGQERVTKDIDFINVEPNNYRTTKTVTRQTNTLNCNLTKADVWYVKYEMNYQYNQPTSNPNTSEVRREDQQFPENAERQTNTYVCEEIVQAEMSARRELLLRPSVMAETIAVTHNVTTEIRTRYINIHDDITSTTESSSYTFSPADVTEKVDETTAPNFVTIFNKSEYRANKRNILSVDEWLFEILENNTSTSNHVDLMKYLLYKATGTVYDGIDSVDLSILYPNQITAVGEGDYIVHIDRSSSDIVINDINKLKTAFTGYSGHAELVRYAQDFLDLQERYRVNAVFAAAVSISETSAGRRGHAVDGKNNWFNIECTCGGNHGRFETYSSVRQSIEAFYKQISVRNYYFTAGRFTVSEIGMVYCENADAPGGWIENTTTFMSQMFNAAGITPVVSETTDKSEAIVEAARSKLGCAYVWGASGPTTFDCSGLTMWCYNQVGISIPHNTAQQKNSAMRQVPVSEARVGDILWRNGHVAIYIGNNQYIHAPQSGDVVKIAEGANSFTYALQFY